MPRRGRSAELSALREKKKKEQTGAKTTKPQSSVSQNTNRDGGGRTGGLTRQEVAKKVQNAPGYSNGSTIKAYQEKYPTSQKSSVSQTNRSNRSNSSITQNATHRSRNSGAVERGREQTPINRSQTYATAAEMRRARGDEQLKRNPSPTAKEMLAKRQDEEDARKRRINERRARDEEARTRMDKAVQGMSRRQEKTKDLAEESKTDSTAERVVRNTGRAASKGFQDAVSGTAQAALDIEEINYSHKRPGRGAGLQATREYQETKGRESDIQEAIRRRNAKDEMRSKRLGLAEKQEERQQEWDKQTKNIGKAEKAWYGAVESGVGMATDMAIGAATGTGQTGALLSMFGRTYGTTRGQAEKEGATESEDRLNAALQATKETATELMFPGWGLAKGYAGKAGLKAGERFANALTRNMRGKAADVAYAGLRALGGTVEENLEEVAGWGLDPFIKEIAYGRNVRNRAKAQLLADMPALTSREDAEALNARLNSGSFVEELAAEYIANGMPEKKARELAEKMRDFYSAYYAGDDEAVEELGDDLAGELTGAKRISKESFDTSELLDTLASTTMLTAVTGIPGAVTTAQRGAEVKSVLGTEGLKSLAKQVLNSEDAEASERGKVAQAALAAGKEITSTQVYDLEQSLYKQQEKDVKRQNAQLDTAGKQIKENKYVTPFAMDDRGRIVHMEDATIDAYNEAANSAESAIKDVDTKNSLTDTDVMYGARAIAGFKTGAFTIDDANTIVADEAVKQAFEEQTGIDLSQYEVKNKNGSINIPKTNAAIKDALFAMASDNLVQMAEVETANWMDTARGETVRQVTARMGAKGGVAVQLALDDMDERDANTYRNMAVASEYAYHSALNIGVPWEDAKDAITSQFSSIPESKLQMLYEAGLADRAIANDKMLGLQAKIGEAMSKDSEKAEDPTQGQCLIETKQTPKGSVIRVFSDIAANLGVNIHLVDNLPVSKESDRQANGQYIDGEIYINVKSKFEDNLGFIFMHEVTHHLKKYAPEQYKALENLVREEWFKYNPDQMQSEIAKTIKAYEKATKGKQVLTEEEALEEIIADATHEFLMDKNFAKQVADTEPSLAKAVLDSVKEMLRRLRQIFSQGKYEKSRTYMNSFFSQIGILDEAEKLWLEAYTEAVKNKAAVGIVEWQAEANKGESRNSITPEQDSEYMAAVEAGDMDKAQRMVDEAAAEAMPNTKLKGRWYHGTENEFTEFNFSQGGKNGHADGYGIYLTNDPEVAGSYGTRMIEGYVNVERPASALDTATLTNDELHRLIARTVNEEAERLLEDGYDSLEEAKFDTWISNYTDTRYAGDIDKAIDEVIDNITNINGNDYDIVLEIMTGMGIRDYDEASKFYDILTDETGIDGFETKWGDETEMADPNTPTIALAFRSNQIKDASPVTYDDNGNVIPLSERFNLQNSDIRYSYTTDQEDLIKNGNLPKSLRDWAKEIGLDEISKQPTKGPVEVSVKSLRSAWYQKNDREDEAEVVNKVLDTIGKSLTNMIGKYNYIDLGDAVNASVHYRTDKNGKPISVILTCQVKNAEYEVNFDFTTICSKRLAMQRVLERFIKTEGESKGTLYDELKLDEEGMYKLRLILEKAGFEVSCKGCFVEQNRYSQQAQAKTIADDWNKAIDEWEKENNTKVTENFDLVNMDINALDYEEIQEAFDRYGELIKGRETNVASKNRTLIEAHPFFRKRMNPSDYASMAGQRALMAIGAKGGRNLYGLLKRGQSDSKQSVPFTAYNGEIALLPDNMKGRELFDYLMSIGGARAQSASDFQIEYFYDYMQLVADLSARGLPMHMYTKVIELAELFGMTGVKINLSAMCDVDESLGGEYAGLKLVDGKYEYNISDQSIDYEKAVELQKKPGYSKNIGIIMVVLSKQHMLKSLDDNDVRYIIGYHSSSMPAVVAQMTNMGNATDYTKLNKTNKLNDKGKALFAKAMEQAKGKTKLDKYKDALRIFDDMIQEEVSQDKKAPRRGNEYARYMSGYGGNTAEFNTYDDLKKSNDARKTADNYIEWCMNNDLIPIYFPFAFHDNYYKCEIYDFNMYDNVDGSYAPMEAVQNIYPDLDMTKGETDSTKFMETVTGMMDERNKINEGLDSMYDNVFDEAKNELKFSITGDEYLDFDEADIDRTQLTPRAEAIKTEEQKRDEAYMSAVNSGNMEEAQKLVDQAAKEAGYTTRAYHGTGSNFTVFDPERSGKNYNGFSKYGQGLYFTDSEDRANEWGKGRKLLSVYLKADNFFDETRYTSNETLMKEYNRLRRENDPALVREFERRGMPFDRTEEITGIVFEEINRDSGDKGFTTQLLKSMGYDGVKAEHEGFTGSPAWTEYVVFDPEQIKLADTVTYAEDGSVIPLSERFDPNNDDIRYSMSTQDSDGNVLTDDQMEYFKNSKARDEQGKMLVMYHGTPAGPRITVFDTDTHAYWFSPNEETPDMYAMQYEYNIPGAMVPIERNPYDSDEEYFASMGIRFEQNDDGEWEAIRTDNAGRDDYYDYAYETKEELINHLYDEAERGYLQDSSFELRNYYSCYLNLENPMVIECGESEWDDINGTGMSTNDYVAQAQAEGYDGVIFKNVVDPWEPTDVYVAFSSNQIKDTRNENPTENPDIRYSITPEDEAQSRIAYEDSMDDSYDELAKYEMMLDEGRFTESMLSKPFSEDQVSAFYAGLRSVEPRIYSDPVLQEDAVRLAKSKDEFFNNVNAKWQARWATGGEVLKIESVRKDIQNLVIGTMSNSDTPAKYRNEIVRKTLIDARIAFQLMKQDRTDVASALLYHSAQRMLDGVEFIQDDMFKQYKDLRDYLRTTRISLGEEYWSDVDYDAFRKRNMGKIRMVKGNTNVDEIYQEMCDMWPEWFEEEEDMTAPDMLLQMEHVLDVIQPYKEAYSSEEATELCYDIADQLYEIIAKGDEVVSLADTYKNKYDRQTKAMKERHEEALRKVREQRDEGIKAERAKWKVREQARKERSLHRQYFASIAESHKTLVDRLRTNTADKHIPEQYKKDLAGLLAAFDLQTVASKKREAKDFHRSQKAIQMSAIRTALRQIEAKSEMFHMNDAITDIIDELLGEHAEQRRAATIEGKTLDELSASELKRIDKLLKALIHEFNTYENVRINARNVMAEDLSRAQVTSAIEHAKKFGEGSDWFGPRGWLDKIINMDEVTPAYMFKMIDPNNEGLGQMWKEIKRSHDRYIRNTDQLTQWMDEIIGKYHSKGRGSKKYGAKQIEEWRSSRYTQTFNLTNGSITLTPAQMMSVACLANRNQAYQHMIGAGVVAAPVSFQNKMETDLKRKTNYALPLIFTDADIKQIVTALTPEQKKVAEELQQLMATKMAEWGNEASMDVIGIKLFEEPDYFPIKSDKAALQKDWTADQFDQAIRNFGFTKAVQPGARNAIVIDDIFEVVAEHCNNMNLYNAYSKTLNDFMKVYNKHTIMEDGADYSVAQAISHAYSQKATNFIMEFVKDLNGNVSTGKRTGIDAALNDGLANAKKAAVFANIRVFLQQPTAITRAFAVISPKYLKGVSLGDIAKGMIPKVTTEAMNEMFEHCPIAKWKSWGYYDINMGKTIEDVIMNEGNWLEDLATDAYGKADNITWTAIWQMVKAEMKDTHPDVEIGTDEYWELCNERMSEIVDYTQVVDSPLHRSHAMRSKSFMTKMFTSFMAEPTLTFNMVRDAFIRAKEAWVSGDKSKAGKILGKVTAVYMLQAVTVSAAAAIADALRGKTPDGDDDEGMSFGSLWWINALNNFKDEMKIWNKIYYVKDLASMLEGWDQRNLALQGWNDLFTGFNQMQKKLYEGSKVPWWKIYSNFFGGFGSLIGVPIKTVMKDGRAIFELLGGELPASLVGDSKSSPVVDGDSKIGKIFAPKSDSDKTTSVIVSDDDHWYDYENNPLTIKDGSALDKFLNHFGVNLTQAEKAAALQAKKDKEFVDKRREIKESVLDLTGEEKEKATWKKVSDYIKESEGMSVAELVSAGDYATLNKYRSMYIAAGNASDYFDQMIFDKSKSEMKKTIIYDPTEAQIAAQENIKSYLTEHGMSEYELSEIAYKSETKKDLQVACRINDEEAMVESLVPLIRAGLTYDDFVRIYDNRNRVDLVKYKNKNGRYADKLKSMGTFIWPTEGVVTSHFGYRNAPTAGASSNHPAIDIGASTGTPVVAADGGVVIYADSNGGYGNSVGIKHDNGMVTYYNHLYSWNVKVGDTVAQGQQIAQVGSTGISTGPHLDFKILDKNGKPVDPEKYLS